MENIISNVSGKWNEFRYLLFDETGFILTIICFLISIVVFFSIKKKIIKRIAVLALMVTVLLGGNYIDIKYINPKEEKGMCIVPDVTELTYSNAQIVLRTCGLKEQIMSYDSNILAVTDDHLVYMQNPVAGTKVEMGSTVVVSLEEFEIVENKSSDLSLKITDYTIFTDGFYCEEPEAEDTNSFWIIEFDKGFYGTYELSRSLGEIEQRNWLHGGSLYDAEGNVIGKEGNYPSFWASSGGMFAVEFPDGLPEGTYNYELSLYIDGQYVTDSISIVFE